MSATPSQSKPAEAQPATQVPLLDLKPQYRPLAAEIQAVIEKVCESQHFILGAAVKELEAIAWLVTAPMRPNLRSINSLLVPDLQIHPVWEFAGDEEADDETLVRPVEVLPVQSLAGRLAATNVRLSNGATAWALIGNIELADPRSAEHFLTLRIERDGVWFDLARYFDPDYTERGPAALAEFLRLAVDDVFPIHFDIRYCVTGNSAALVGSIQCEGFVASYVSSADLCSAVSLATTS